MDRKIFDFTGFRKFSNNLLLEETGKGSAVMVGDSTVSSINDSIKGLSQKPEQGSVKKGVVKPGLYCPGIGSKGFLKMINSYSKTHPEVTFVFLAMGTNDVYTISEDNKKTAFQIVKRLKQIFPNSAKMYIIKGTGWGWGESTKEYYPKWMWKNGDIKKGPVDNSPAEIDEYYDQVWAPTGITLIPVTIGIAKNEKGYSKHIGPQTPGVAELRKYIESVLEGRVQIYKEKIKSTDSEKPVLMGDSGSITDFYDSFENAFNDEIIISPGDRKSKLFNPIVQKAQIALDFLGFKQMGNSSDGLYGKETADAVLNFKKKYRVSGNPESMDDNFFAALLNALKRRKFKKKDLQQSSSKEKMGAYQDLNIDMIGGDNEYLMYLAHNQGAAGASQLVKAMLGLGNKLPKWKNIRGNVPEKLYPGSISKIKAAYDSGDFRRAATIFLGIWKDRYNNVKKNILNDLNKPQNSEVKKAITASAGEIPLNTLGTFAYIESGLNPKAGNQTYKGLFALNPNPSGYASKYGINYQNVYDPYANSKAAAKFIKDNTASFLKNVGDQAISQLNLSGLKSRLAQ